jgi:hypothetical protein
MAHAHLPNGSVINCETQAEAQAIEETGRLFREIVGKELNEDKLRQVDFTARTLLRYGVLNRYARRLCYKLADSGWSTPIHILR